MSGGTGHVLTAEEKAELAATNKTMTELNKSSPTQWKTTGTNELTLELTDAQREAFQKIEAGTRTGGRTTQHTYDALANKLSEMGVTRSTWSGNLHIDTSKMTPENFEAYSKNKDMIAAVMAGDVDKAEALAKNPPAAEPAKPAPEQAPGVASNPGLQPASLNNGKPLSTDMKHNEVEMEVAKEWQRGIVADGGSVGKHGIDGLIGNDTTKGAGKVEHHNVTIDQQYAAINNALKQEIATHNHQKVTEPLDGKLSQADMKAIADIQKATGKSMAGTLAALDSESKAAGGKTVAEYAKGYIDTQQGKDAEHPAAAPHTPQNKPVQAKGQAPI